MADQWGEREAGTLCGMVVGATLPCGPLSGWFFIQQCESHLSCTVSLCDGVDAQNVFWRNIQTNLILQTYKLLKAHSLSHPFVCPLQTLRHCLQHGVEVQRKSSEVNLQGSTPGSAIYYLTLGTGVMWSRPQFPYKVFENAKRVQSSDNIAWHTVKHQIFFFFKTTTTTKSNLEPG